MSTIKVDSILPFSSGSTTIVVAGTLNTTASYALTASYAMNGGGGGATLIETTYSELSASAVAGTLVPLTNYLITDFKTCYDQPDYDYNGMSIQIGNYRTGSVSPIIVFALDSGSLASDAYQPQYPNDNIKYDITFNQTEVTTGSAFGRIVYRKDDQGNAFDYDFREVLFKRYDTYFSEQVYQGTVSVNVSSSVGVVTGVSSSFTQFTSGNVVGVLDVNNSPIVTYYEILSIEDDFNMIVTGSVINNVSDKRLVDANLLEGMSWKQNNILSNTSSVELPTFGNIGSCFGNTSTNTAAYTVWDGYTFLLPNNVFKGGSTYLDNSFGHDFRNNTFNASCDSNRIGGLFYNNIIDNDFDNNIINDNFYDNIIDCDFQRNTIMGEFRNNHFGDYNEEDFDYNAIYNTFSNNFYTGVDHFEYNIIKGDFSNNIILGEFSKNTLNGFSDNVLEATFSDSQVGESFYNNKTYQEFRENTIGDECYDNNFYSSFLGNVLIGDQVYDNNFYSVCERNQIGSLFTNNSIGDSGSIGATNFRDNIIGYGFDNNTINGDFGKNEIGYDVKGNLILGSFEENKIGTSFANNEIQDGFYSNNIGNYFFGNDIGQYFDNNFILNYFNSNNIQDNFSNNKIGNGFSSNIIGNNFGYGGGEARGNVIGNNFYDNTINEYFYDNAIGDNFENNTVGNYFQFNRIETTINSYDFTEFLGGVNFVSFPSTAGTDGIYTDLSGITSGSGVDAVFTVGVAGDVVNTVSVTTPGKLYQINDTITISSGSFGGNADLVLTVTILDPSPSVYETYNCNIFERRNGDKRLSYYDENDVLTITDITV